MNNKIKFIEIIGMAITIISIIVTILMSKYEIPKINIENIEIKVIQNIN